MTAAEMLTTPQVVLVDNRPATTSLDIAEHFDKRHDDVIKSIRNLSSNCPEEFNARNFAEVEYMDAKGEKRPMFTVYFDGFILLVMGYTGKKALGMKLAYIDAFNAMREELEHRNEPVENTKMDKFRNLSISEFTAPDAPLTPDQQCTLQAIVRAKVEALPREQRGGLYPKTWSRFNNHFRLAKYCQLPQSRLSEAVAYLTQLDVPEGKQALPTASTALSPAPAFRMDFPADMHTGRKDALRKIQSLMTGVGAARDVVRLFCHPGGKSMRMTLDEREIYDALYQLYCAADDSLLAAYRALDAGYKIGRQYGRG